MEEVINKTKLNKGRVLWLDLIKAFSIFLVLVGHSIQYYHHSDQFWTNPVWEMIYSFHMPLFFMVSGCVFNGNVTIKKFLITKIRTLLIPFIIWNLIAFPFKRRILFNDLWFIIVLFVDLILLYALYNLWKKNKYIAISFAIVIFLFPIIEKIPYAGLYRYYLIFLILGKYTYRILDNSKLSNFLLVITTFIFICFAPLYEGFFQGVFNTFYVINPFSLDKLFFITIYKLIIGFSASYMIFYSFSRITINEENLMIKIGQSTLGIYLLQFILLERLFPHFINLRFINIDNIIGQVLYIAIAIAIAIVSLLICYVTYSILLRSRFLSLVLFGKTNKLSVGMKKV